MENGRIYIGDNITIVVVEIDRGKVRLGIEAPDEVPIHRDNAKRREKRPVASTDNHPPHDAG